MIAYHVQYMRVFLTDILARMLAKKVARVGEDPRVCPTRGERSYSCGGRLNGEVAGHVPRAELSEDAVTTSWNDGFCDIRETICYSARHLSSVNQSFYF